MAVRRALLMAARWDYSMAADMDMVASPLTQGTSSWPVSAR